PGVTWNCSSCASDSQSLRQLKAAPDELYSAQNFASAPCDDGISGHVGVALGLGGWGSVAFLGEPAGDNSADRSDRRGRTAAVNPGAALRAAYDFFSDIVAARTATWAGGSDAASQTQPEIVGESRMPEVAAASTAT